MPSNDTEELGMVSVVLHAKEKLLFTDDGKIKHEEAKEMGEKTDTVTKQRKRK